MLRGAVSRDYPFATWNILDCGLDANSTGSHYWETAVVECIARARHELPALKAAAVRVGKEARKTDGVGRCIAAVAGAFAGEDS